MIDKIQYCLQDILTVQKLLKIDNCGFYKRALARLIAIRTGDLIPLFFSYNKSLSLKTIVDKQKVKNEVTALESLYKDYLKKQRDKFGGHFQDIDFIERINLWSKIDIYTADFFIEEPLKIYKLFQSCPGYIPPEKITTPLPKTLLNKIKRTNKEFDIESQPHSASDILALTRFNTGGTLYLSPAQEKAAVLKSLEIIIDYEFILLDIPEATKQLIATLKKLTILDILSYSDNLYTRDNLSPGAKQEMDGLDKLISKTDFLEVFKILDEFKTNYRYQEIITKLRPVRNEICAHIDDTKPLSDLIVELDSITVNDLRSFYDKLKAVFEKICQEEHRFIMFRTGPYKLNGALGFASEEIAPFDKQSTVPRTFSLPDYDNLKLIEKHYQDLVNNRNHEEVRNFFWETFCGSRKKKGVPQKVKSNFKHFDDQESEFSRAHQYFYNKLSDPQIDITQKIAIINLFCECKSGFPDILTKILLLTYEINKRDKVLNLRYLYAFGELLVNQMRKYLKY